MCRLAIGTYVVKYFFANFSYRAYASTSSLQKTLFFILRLTEFFLKDYPYHEPIKGSFNIN